MNRHFHFPGLTASVRTAAFRHLSVVALAASLSACGGGGGSSSSEGTAPLALPNSSAVTALSAGQVYPAGSEEQAAYTLLNAERDRCGFGLLAANAPLNAAAKAHADYQIINSLNSHLENQIQYPDGFTGADPAARVKAQGYTDLGGVTDEFAFFTFSGVAQPKRGIGELGIRGLLNAPYHLNGLMSGYRDVGIAVRSNEDIGKGMRGIFVQINPAYKAAAGPQLPDSTSVLTYPCEGTTGVNRELTNETPNPVKDRDLRIRPLGSSVYIAVRPGNRLVISQVAMTQAATGEAIILRDVVTEGKDIHGPCQTGCFEGHEAYIVPDAPLQPETAYTVMVSGTNNGNPFSRNFSFSTGPD